MTSLELGQETPGDISLLVLLLLFITQLCGIHKNRKIQWSAISE